MPFATIELSATETMSLFTMLGKLFEADAQGQSLNIHELQCLHDLADQLAKALATPKGN